MTSRRALLVVLDSLGCGGAEDAARYGDGGADTLGHIAQACAAGRADVPGLREGPLRMPVLAALGLGLAGQASSGTMPPGLETPAAQGLWGYAIEQSAGKDTPSGHWELAGTRVSFAFGYFPATDPAFPQSLVTEIVQKGKLPGILGNCHHSGIAIIDDYGEEHLASGKPILYTSTDSVLQIAAHEDAFGLQRLYDLCETVRDIVNPMHLGRVIARPFLGRDRSDFKRTPHRKDYAMQPPEGNILDRAAAASRTIVSIGKIGDIFCHRNTGKEIKGNDDMDLFDKMLTEWDALPDGGLMFANFVDLDTDFGHRRNVAGYAAGLEKFDSRMGQLLPRLRSGDLVIVTADHGNDPTWSGTDHTREHVPVLAFGPEIESGSLGARDTFADVGATIADYLGLVATKDGAGYSVVHHRRQPPQAG